MKNLVKGSLFSVAAVAAVVMGMTAPSVAQNAPSPAAKVKTAVEARQSVFKLLSFELAPMSGMLRNQVPFDAAATKTNGQNVANLAKLIPALFATDTHESSDVKTGALPGIWTAMDAFKGKAMDLQNAAEALVKASDSGDQTAVKQAIGAVGKACGSCHDDFRAKS